MRNTSVRAAAEGMPIYPQKAGSTAFFRKLPMPWHSCAGKEPAEPIKPLESFMNQHVDRRALLASSAIATAAIAAASQDASAGTSAASVSCELEGLIQAKHAAYARFETAIDRATALEEEYLPKTAEMYVPLSIGGGQSRSLRYSELESVE